MTPREQNAASTTQTPVQQTLRRRWFGPSKDEIWRQLALELPAEYVQGGVRGTHSGWTILLDTYVHNPSVVEPVTGMVYNTPAPYTRMRARFGSDCDLRLDVRRRGFFTDFAKLLGMQDISVGFEPFDEQFVIKGQNEERIRELFADASVRELLQKQPKVHFTVSDHHGLPSKKLPEGVRELNFVVAGDIKDIDRLKALYDLFAATLDRLSEMGCARPLPADLASF